MKKKILALVIVVMIMMSGCAHTLMEVSNRPFALIVEEDAEWDASNIFGGELESYTLTDEELEDINYEMRLNGVLYRYDFNEHDTYQEDIDELMDFVREMYANEQGDDVDQETLMMYKSLISSIENTMALESEFFQASQVIINYSIELFDELAVAEGDELIIPIKSVRMIESYKKISEEDKLIFAEKFAELTGAEIEDELKLINDYYDFLGRIVGKNYIVADVMTYSENTTEYHLIEELGGDTIRTYIDNKISYYKPEAVKELFNYTSSDWSVRNIESLRSVGSDIIPEVNDFNETITRESFTRLLVDLHLKLNPNEVFPTALENPFIDTDNQLILSAYNLGLINGTSPVTFDPEGSLTREQAATILARYHQMIYGETEVSDQYYSDADLFSEYAINPINLMGTLSIMQGYNNEFNPKGQLTVEEAVAIIDRFLKMDDE